MRWYCRHAAVGVAMSAHIGDVAGFAVWVSRGGVEVHGDITTNRRDLTPVEARNLAALLVRAGDEVERMRERNRVNE
jgi:hypothetical protein